MTAQLLSFSIAGQLCGIEACFVREVRPLPQRITRTPACAPAVLGVSNLRGRIAAVISLRRCLGLDDAARGTREMCLVVEHKGELYSLAVDEVGLVLSLQGNDEPVPPTLDARWRAAMTGVCRTGGGLLAVLDIPGMIDALCRNEKEKTPPEGL